MNEPTTQLEFQLEMSKHISNLRFDLLKRIYDGQAVIEGYERVDVELHLHASGVCGVWTRCEINCPSGLSDDQMAMLIWVGNGLKSLRPINSVVRLQKLNSCRMHLADPTKAGSWSSPEAVWRIINRELSTLLHSAGIEDGKFIDKIIESGSQIVNCFPDENRVFKRDRNRWGELHISAYAIEHNLHLSLKQANAEVFQFGNMFFCPTEPDISTIKSAHDEYTSFLNQQPRQPDKIAYPSMGLS